MKLSPKIAAKISKTLERVLKMSCDVADIRIIITPKDNDDMEITLDIGGYIEFELRGNDENGTTPDRTAQA